MTDTVKGRLFLQKLLALFETYGVTEIGFDTHKTLCGQTAYEYINIVAKDFYIEIDTDSHDVKVKDIMEQFSFMKNDNRID
jgi:hypothetical protein